MPTPTIQHRIAFMIASYLTETMSKDFFDKLDQELRKRGLRIVANQLGVRGTHICIDKVEEPQ